MEKTEITCSHTLAAASICGAEYGAGTEPGTSSDGCCVTPGMTGRIASMPKPLIVPLTRARCTSCRVTVHPGAATHVTLEPMFQNSIMMKTSVSYETMVRGVPVGNSCLSRCMARPALSSASPCKEWTQSPLDTLVDHVAVWCKLQIAEGVMGPARSKA